MRSPVVIAQSTDETGQRPHDRIHLEHGHSRLLAPPLSEGRARSAQWYGARPGVDIFTEQ